MSISKKIIADSLRFSSSNYVYYTLKIVSSLMFRRVLTPLLMGHLSFLFLIFEHCKYSHLGVLNALDREIPLQAGRGDFEKVKEVKNVSFNFYFFSTLLASFILLGVFFCANTLAIDTRFSDGFFLIPFLIIAYMFDAYYRVILRSQHQFKLLSKVNMIAAVIEVTSAILFVILWGIKGVLLSLMMTFAFSGMYLKMRSQENLVLNARLIQIPELKRLLKVGFPLIVYDFVRMAFLNIDKIMIVSLLGYAELGLYSVATMAFNFLMPFPRSIYNVLSPYFFEAYGRTGNIEELKKFLIKPTLIMAYLFSIVIGLAIIGLSPLIYHVLPQYRGGVLSVFVLLLSAFFYSIIFMWGYFLIAIHKQTRMVQFNGIAVFISIFLNYLFIKVFGLGIFGVAIATTLTYATLSTMFISYVYSFYSEKIRDHFFLLATFYFPMGWVLLILMGLQVVMPYSHLSVWNDCVRGGILSLFLLMGSLPLILYVNKKAQILNRVYEVLRRKGISGAQTA